jgi:UDP-N-acetylglucosamine 1-carboxyvinyltransferase
MQDKFIIEGKKKLKGVLQVKGAKNAAFPVLAATLLTDKPCYIYNLPLVEDVLKMIKVLETIGCRIEWFSERDVKIESKNINIDFLPEKEISYLRGSVVILGSILARFGKIRFVPPGGCLIGVRPIDVHLDAFNQIGINIKINNNFFYFEGFPKPAEVVLKEISVTATENILLALSLVEKTSFLKIASNDYPVVQLIKCLRLMGVKVEEVGIGSFKIVGKKKLNGFKIRLMEDPIEAGTFISLALATRSNILIKDVPLCFLTLFIKRLKDFGANFKINKNEVLVLPSGILKIDKIQSMIYPGIHTDLQPELGVLATQSKGPTLIHDPLFEGRLKYLDELNKMGASIIFCDPHRAIINGPTQLYGRDILSLDIRAGMAFIIAGLVAEGTTILSNVYQIDRGYEKIEERLRLVGANIKRVKE